MQKVVTFINTAKFASHLNGRTVPLYHQDEGGRNPPPPQKKSVSYISVIFEETEIELSLVGIGRAV
jgi:hypothetical protein